MRVLNFNPRSLGEWGKFDGVGEVFTTTYAQRSNARPSVRMVLAFCLSVQMPLFGLYGVFERTEKENLGI